MNTAVLCTSHPERKQTCAQGTQLNSYAVLSRRVGSYFKAVLVYEVGCNLLYPPPSLPQAHEAELAVKEEDNFHRQVAEL